MLLEIDSITQDNVDGIEKSNISEVYIVRISKVYYLNLNICLRLVIFTPESVLFSDLRSKSDNINLKMIATYLKELLNNLRDIMFRITYSLV